MAAWSSTTHGLETILGVDMEGTRVKVWENGEVCLVVACVDGAMVEEEARHEVD